MDGSRPNFTFQAAGLRFASIGLPLQLAAFVYGINLPAFPAVKVLADDQMVTRSVPELAAISIRECWLED